MRLVVIIISAFALAGLAGLLWAGVFPALDLIAPKAPALIDVNGVEILSLEPGRVRYQSAGEGQGKDDHAIVLLHGFNNQLGVWNGVWPLLEKCGRRVRLDIPGFGGSTWPTDDFGLPAQAARVVSAFEALGLERVTLVGVSMGGSLAAWIAAYYPERVQALVLLAPSGYPGSLNYGGPFGKLLRPGLVNALARRLAATERFKRDYPSSAALQALSVTSSYGEPWAEALEKIQAPTWLVWSRGDAGVPFSFAADVAKRLVHGKLVPLEESVGHDIPAARPELIARLACEAQAGGTP